MTVRVPVQIVRAWVERFNARGPDGLINSKTPGSRSKLNDTQRQALAEVVKRSPILAIHSIVRWHCKNLA